MPRLLYRIISACCLCLPLPSLAAESLDESALMVVTSADGHANVRTRPSTAAPVSARLPTATVLFRNDAEFNTTAHDTWYPVVFAQDAWCRGCDDTWTNTDSGHARRGWIHRSQLTELAKLPAAPNSFAIHYQTRPFNRQQAGLTWSSDRSHVQQRNRQPVFGGDCGMPTADITAAHAQLNGQRFTLPTALLDSLHGAGSRFDYRRYQQHYFAAQQHGDGACTHYLVWVFNQNGLQQRFIGHIY